MEQLLQHVRALEQSLHGGICMQWEARRTCCDQALALIKQLPLLYPLLGIMLGACRDFYDWHLCSCWLGRLLNPCLHDLGRLFWLGLTDDDCVVFDCIR